MQKALIYLIYYGGTHLKRWTLPLLAAVLALLLFLSTTWFDAAYYKFWDNDPDRGAKTAAAKDAFGDEFSKVVYLEQGWAPSDSLWFYNINQGSDLMPYDFFLALEQKDSQELFRSDENMNRFRYMPQKKTRSNPDALPVGMVADFYHGKKYMGFTCAACHSSQANYKGVGIRIDGGPGEADMDSFMKSLAASLQSTVDDAAKKQRFVAAVLKAGNYGNEQDISKDLETYALRVRAYNFFNESQTVDKDGKLTPVDYGYARLDAFGRIYNRVLEYVLNPEALRIVLLTALPQEEADKLLADLHPILTDENRDHLMDRLITMLTPEQRSKLRDKIFNSPNAPVSYPFVWDIPHHDYVQWNGIGGNAGAGPIGRNSGEVIGVFGTLDWAEKKGWTINSVLEGQGFGKTHVSFKSSVKVHHLRQIEDRLASLQSPLWNDAVAKAGLPALDQEKVRRGERLFDQLCVTCHARIDRTSPQRRVVAHMNNLKEIGTDPVMATNSVTYRGYSGLLRNWYVTLGVGNVMLDIRAPVAAILTKATQNVVATPDPDKWFFTRFADWAIDLIDQVRKNEIKPSVRSGDYTPDTTAAPLESLKAYKGRSLNGIWATAPYLHNGSVPTLYDLLLPASPRENDPAGTVYRPKTFRVGSRELDVDNVGFKHEGYDGFLFDTSIPNNSNSGHEYGTRIMTEQDRRDLVEYIKSL
jgi:mono/diheme cytochrome c family protein